MKIKVDPYFVGALVLFIIAGYLLAEWRGVIAAILIHIGANFWLAAGIDAAVDRYRD